MAPVKASWRLVVCRPPLGLHRNHGAIQGDRVLRGDLMGGPHGNHRRRLVPPDPSQSGLRITYRLAHLHNITLASSGLAMKSRKFQK